MGKPIDIESIANSQQRRTIWLAPVDAARQPVDSIHQQVDVDRIQGTTETVMAGVERKDTGRNLSIRCSICHLHKRAELFEKKFLERGKDSGISPSSQCFLQPTFHLHLLLW